MMDPERRHEAVEAGRETVKPAVMG